MEDVGLKRFTLQNVLRLAKLKGIQVDRNKKQNGKGCRHFCFGCLGCRCGSCLQQLQLNPDSRVAASWSITAKITAQHTVEVGKPFGKIFVTTCLKC